MHGCQGSYHKSVKGPLVIGPDVVQLDQATLRRDPKDQALQVQWEEDGMPSATQRTGRPQMPGGRVPVSDSEWVGWVPLVQDEANCITSRLVTPGSFEHVGYSPPHLLTSPFPGRPSHLLVKAGHWIAWRLEVPLADGGPQVPQTHRLVLAQQAAQETSSHTAAPAPNSVPYIHTYARYVLEAHAELLTRGHGASHALLSRTSDST
jgi:hypothetical protein